MDGAGSFVSRRRLLRSGGAAAIAACGLVRADAKRPIILGHTYPASGIFADTIHEMKAAIDAAVLAINTQGGIGGRMLQVVSLDDGYDPKQSVANAERPHREHGAIALVAPVGAPVLAALAPWAQRSGLPLIGARSGADAQRSYQRQVFFNIASFGDEARYLARHMATIGTRRVAVAMIDNPTGRDIAERFAAAASTHALTLAATLPFDPAGGNAAAAAQRLSALDTRTLLLAGGGNGVVALVRELLAHGWRASSVYGLSMQQPMHLHKLLGARCDGMVFAQVMPAISDARVPLVTQYRQALDQLPGNHKPSAFALEAWLSMQIAALALSRIDGVPSAAALTDSLERLGRFEIGGFRLHYDASSHHGTRYVDLGLLSNGCVLR